MEAVALLYWILREYNILDVLNTLHNLCTSHPVPSEVLYPPHPLVQRYTTVFSPSVSPRSTSRVDAQSS